MGNAIPTPTFVTLNDAIASAWAGIEIPLEVAERSPGISPLAIQSLLDYFRQRTRDRGEPIEDLTPADPGSDDAATNYSAIVGRCAKYLNSALGPAGPRSFAIALLVTKWMRGFPLSRLIDDRLRYEQSLKSGTTKIPSVIRAVLDDVERIARFEAPRTFTAYIDVLRLFLTESDRLDLVSQVEDLAIFLELGVSIPTQISLMALGLSRSTAIKLSEFAANDSLNETGALDWLQTGGWELIEMPELMKREIREAIAAQVAQI